ncbi:MAG: exonuclease III, partial [Chlamydiales bacterium]
MSSTFHLSLHPFFSLPQEDEDIRVSKQKIAKLHNLSHYYDNSCTFPYHCLNTFEKISRLLGAPFFNILNSSFRLSKEWSPGRSYQHPSIARELVKRTFETAKVLIQIPPALLLSIPNIPLSLGLCCLNGSMTYLKGPSIPFPQFSGGIKVITLNTALMPEYISTLNNMRPPYERAHEIARRLLMLDADLICLQEVFDHPSTEALSEELKSKYPFIIHSVAPRWLGLNSGLFIASKYEMIDPTFWHFDTLSGGDLYANKGVLSVSLLVTGRKVIQVFNTHLQAQNGRWKERLVALEQIKSIVSKRMFENSHTIGSLVCGDFNVAPLTDEGDPDITWTHPWGLSIMTRFFQNFYIETKLRKPENREDDINGTFWNMSPENSWGGKEWKASPLEGCTFDHILGRAPSGNHTLRGTVRISPIMGDASDHLLMGGTIFFPDKKKKQD